jgi:hypothetical protein
MVDGYAAECFWPGVTPRDVELLDRRVARAVAELASSDGPVRYLGSLLLREDEVVLCRFAGTLASVEAVARRARVPYERLLATLATAERAPA